MLKRIISNKVIAFLILLLIILAEVLVIPVKAYATNDEFNKQNNNTNNSNVKFDTFFTEGDVNTRNITVTNNALINFNFEVQKGYLTNVKVQIQNPNFNLNNSNNVDIIGITDNIITFKDINGISNIQIPIEMPIKDKMKLEDIEKETTVLFQATYINNNGREINIKKELNLKLKWNLNTEFNLSGELISFIANGEKTLLGQKINLSPKDRKNPIKETKIAVNVPQIGDYLPEEVRVSANSTKATNGDTYGVNFGNNNYSYNAESKQLLIQVQNNANENSEISFIADKDEYLITYVYNKPINELLKSEINVSSDVSSQITTYGSETIIQNNDKKDYIINKQVGSNISAEIYCNDQINKGFLYDNYNETTYNLYYKININNKDANNTININTNTPIINLGQNEGTTDKIYFKQLAIKEDLFKKILGENGYINIFDNNNNLIGKITKDTEKNSAGELEVTYSDYQKNIRIEISKPQVEGYIELRNYKVIDKKLNYNINLVKQFESIKERIKIDKNYEKDIKLNETYTKVDLTMDNTNFTPYVDNNVNMTLNLVTNSNKYDLFKNPEIKIVFPEEIEKIDIKEISLLYNTELKLESADLNNRELTIKLSGEETNYKLGIQEGTKILIPAVIRLKNTVSTKETNLKMTYSNDLAENTEYSVQNKDCINVPFNINAKSGLITVSSLSGYNEKETQLALDENTVKAQLELNSTAKTANVNTTIVNNYESEISNVRIIGKIPFVGNTNLNGEDFGSTFDAKLKQELNAKGINATVYYSENNETDENSANWKSEIENIQNAKSYKIVLNKNIAKSEEFNFNFDFMIPEQLTANQKTFLTYTVRYDLGGQNLETSQTFCLATPEIKNEITNNVTTGEVGSLDMNVKEILGDTELENNSDVYEGQVLRFEIEVTNNTSSDISNISVEANIPEDAVYVSRYDIYEPISEQELLDTFKEEERENVLFNVDTLKVNETKKMVYEIKIAETENQKLTSIIDLKVNNETFKEIKIDNNIKDAKITTELFVKRSSAVIENTNFSYVYKVKNNTNESISNIKATIEIPKNIEISEYYILASGLEDDINNTENATFDVNNNMVTCNVKTLESGQEARFAIIGNIKYIESVDQEITTFANTYVGNETYKSNLSIIPIKGADVTITKSSPTMNQEVTNGDTITYNITVTNNSQDAESQVYIIDRLPKEVTAGQVHFNQFNYASITEENTYSEEEKDVDLSVVIEETNDTSDNSRVMVNYDKEQNILTIPSMLPAGKTINISIEVKVDKVTEDKELINIAEVNGDYVVSKTSNEVKHFAKYYSNNPNNPTNPSNPDDPNDPNQQDGRYSINGSVWVDENENGIMDSDEGLAYGNEITVVDADTSEIAENAVGQKIEAKSSGTGYTLSGLEPGKYIVIFKYDRNNYKITQYKKEGASEVLTSKAIATTAKIDGNTEYVGMTDVIEITNSNVSYINMGLVRTSTFDIGIDKVLSGIQTIQKNGQQKTYTYDNVKMGKLEIAGKNIEGTTVNIEYTITISNNGQTKGYIQSIIDELPDGLEFNQLLNDNWYEENGRLYNTEITELNAGESKQVKLILTKLLTQENLGIFNNTALFAATNANDAMDSNQSNNQSSARLIIGTSTGRTIFNVVVMIILLSIIAGGIHFIKRFNTERR